MYRHAPSTLLVAATLLVANAHAAEPVEEFIVTGERIERTQKETAASVAVTLAADLEDFAGPDTLERIFQQTANVTTSGAANQGPTIRGSNTSGVLTSLESFFGGSQPRTTVQVDGRQLTFNEFVYSGESAWDIDRVEIFRGPQTTTQGRNAIAGAVYIVTANPDHDTFSARARGIVGEDGIAQSSGVVSGPLGNGDVAYRLAVDYREEDSTITPLGVTEDIGAELNQSELLNVRGKLSYRPGGLDDFNALLTLTHADTRRPQTDSVDTPFENRERFNPAFSVFDTRSNAAVLELNLEASEWLTLRNITTYSDVGVQRLAPAGTGNADIDSDELTNELIASFDSNGGRLSGIAGAYVSRFESDESLNLSAFGIGVGTFSDQRDSVGAFAEATWSATDRVHFTAGGRWQEDSQDRQGGFAGIIPISFDEEFSDFLPKAELAVDIGGAWRIGVIVEQGFNAGGFTFNFDTFEAETFAAETLWNYELFARSALLEDRLSLNINVFYNDIDDMQIATLVELGPGFFANVFSNAPEARAIGAEVEARLTVNDSLTLQVGLGLSDTEFQSDSNAGALIEGNEFQRTPGASAVVGIVWRPRDNLSLSAFGRYSDGYFSDDANLPGNAVGSYTTLNLRGSYAVGAARLFVDVTNALDRFYELAVFDGGTLASVGLPRQATVGIEVEF